MDHEEYMRQALDLAREAMEAGEVPVGCVVVWEGRVVGRGRNRREEDRDALAHAELIAIRQANETLVGWRLHKADLYVTLEPCAMCAGGIVNARIPRVWYGAADTRFGACGSALDVFSAPLNHRPQVTGGILAEESLALMQQFFQRLREKRKKPASSCCGEKKGDFTMEFQYEDNRIFLPDGKGGVLAEITFPVGADGLPVIDHTFVDNSLRGQGVAGKLMEAAVAALRQSGRQAHATCSYAVNWRDKHPEASDVLL
ncbi:tRNA adenosine(34) deaminase TadA [Pseudoflavonifractor sp.]|jgi:tRNA(adenine34) deaminase|uniref:tRNA adenosine(34) deaminase TadA n=1 Tax=Pseudoflavonifractor sp. TaxID=1980281 RepID=UPI003D91EA14